MVHRHPQRNAGQSSSARSAAYFVAVGLMLMPLRASLAQSAGSLDTSFGGGTVITDMGGPYDLAYAVAVQADAKIVACGNVGVNNLCGVARYTTNGVLDTSFAGTGKVTFGSAAGPSDIVPLPDGRVLVAMGDLPTGGQPGFTIVCLQDNGSPDPSFGQAGRAHVNIGNQPYVSRMRLQTDGRIVVAGHYFTTHYNGAIVRLMPNGAPDTSFGTGGLVTVDFSRPEITNPHDQLYALAIQPDGKIVVGGYTTLTTSLTSPNQVYALARYRNDGTPDSAFGTNGKMVFTQTAGPNPRECIRALIARANGQILACGQDSNHGSYLFRLHRSGAWDTSYGTNGVVNANIASLVNYFDHAILDNQGEVLAIGKTTYDGGNYTVIARYLDDGTADPSFGPGGVALLYFPTGYKWSLPAIAVQPNGMIVVGGGAGASATTQDFALCRLTGDLETGEHYVEFWPTFDVQAIASNGTFALIDGDTTITTYRGGAAAEHRGVMEFDVSDLPPETQVSKARLILQVTEVNGSGVAWPQFEMYGFVGNGSAEVADATNLANDLGPTDYIKTTGSKTYPIGNIAYLQSLLPSPAYLGVMLYENPTGRGATFAALEAGAPPTLAVLYYPPVPGDFDRDRDVDYDDCVAFAACLSGATVHGLSPACARVDFDHDGDVDMEDFGLLQRCYTGPGVAGRPGCLD